MSGFRTKESGAVSLFIVIFSAILITTVSIAFVRVMIQNQQAATTDDLSRSALDSAYAGIEDAKRAIVIYRTECLDSSGNVKDTPVCNKLHDALTDPNSCSTIQDSGILPAAEGESEVVVKQSENDVQLQQAYTCVKVELDTLDVVGSVNSGSSKMIPLRANGNFNQMTIEWYSQEDLIAAIENNPSLPADTSINLPVDVTELPKLGDWPSNRPAMMRLQLIQYGDSFMLDDFDINPNGGGPANTATLFLMPSSAQNPDLSFRRDYNGSGALQHAHCDPNFSADGSSDQFACSATISMQNPLGGSPTGKTAFLRLNTIYNSGTTYRISLENNGSSVRFNAVQPAIDSTGRANDLFRRIRSRVEIGTSSIPAVDVAVDSAGSFCKTFLVTDRESDYSSGSCDN